LTTSVLAGNAAKSKEVRAEGKEMRAQGNGQWAEGKNKTSIDFKEQVRRKK